MKKMFCNYFVIAVVLLISAKVFTKTSQEEQLETLQRLSDDLGASTTMPSETDLKNIQRTVESATMATGVKIIPNAPATTPDEEIKRRREIINSAFKNYNASASAYSKGATETLGAASSSRKLDEPLSEINPEEGAVATGNENIKIATNNDIRDALIETSSEGGSARSKKDETVRTSAGDDSKKYQLPPKAVEVKGKVIIDGGDASMSSNNRKIDEINYKVEETLVGNILMAETKDETTGKTTDTEYMIDTLSKSVDVKSLSGEKCLSVESASASMERCNRSTPYVLSSIDKENKYPNSNSNVIYLEDKGDKIEIKAEIPKIRFSTLMDEASASMHCGNVAFNLSKKEFEKMLNKGKIILKKTQEKSSGCEEGSSVEISLVVTNTK